jgi:undecaprenyl-diphosphatase
MRTSRDKPCSATDDESRLCAEAALQEGVARILTDEDAENAVSALEKAAAGLHQDDVARGPSDVTGPAKRSARIEEVAKAAPSAQEAAAVIAETATQVANAGSRSAPVLDDAIAGTMGVPTDGKTHLTAGAEVVHGRRLLRTALFRRLKPLEALDTAAFLRINRLPHPRWLDAVMRRFSFVMTGGTGWLLPLVVYAIRRPRSGGKAAIDVLPALWLATSTVEYPIKWFFRRRRPFSSIVRAIVVGRKPGSYSFPSGHTAAAFAGAVLLQRYFPRRRGILYSVAALVGFSRIYLGAHYPGDVVTGGLVGALLARAYRGILRRLLGRH